MGRIDRIIFHLYTIDSSQHVPGYVNGNVDLSLVEDLSRPVRSFRSAFNDLHGTNLEITEVSALSYAFEHESTYIESGVSAYVDPFKEVDYLRLIHGSSRHPWLIHHIQIGEASFDNADDAASYCRYLAEHNQEPADINYIETFFRTSEDCDKEDYFKCIRERRKLVQEGKLDLADMIYPIQRLKDEETWVRI